jgi:ubiquinone/menaquinone biosynthesis C-methylase UbiE
MGRLKFSTQDIQAFYEKEAKKHGTRPESTIQDGRTRRLEYEALSKHVLRGNRDERQRKILEVGCGNGWIASTFCSKFDHLDIIAFDFSEALIAQARKQPGNAKFLVADVLNIWWEATFDLVYSVRALQNLVSWADQAKALSNIVRALRPGGEYIMCEGFVRGLDHLNEARAELGLPPIDEPWHNHFFDEGEVISQMEAENCAFVEEECFLSGYYFGSRVLLPALLRKPAKFVKSSSRLNDYFCALPPAGDFCPMKILRFAKHDGTLP